MKIRRALIAAVALVATTATHAAATTWLVPGNGSNTCTTVSPNCNTIAQAVTVSVAGDTISIGAGSFPVTAIQTLSKQLTITGAGMASTSVAISSGVVAFDVRANGIVIQDLTLQGGNTGVRFPVTSNNTQITRVAFNGNTSRGLEISANASNPVTNVTIASSSFTTPNIGLRMASASQVTGLTISATTFGSNLYGIYQANDGVTSKLTNLAISSCTFTNNTNYGIYAEEMRDSTIEDSTFTGGLTGIGLFKFYGTNGVAMSNIGIRRNQFSSFTGNAIDLEIYALGLGSPVAIENNTIQKDVAIATKATAIYVRLHPTLANGAVNLVGNAITASGTFGSTTAVHGVQIAGNGPVTLTGNVFDGGNVGGTGTTPPSSGVFVDSQGNGAMPATTSISGSCNRVQGFHDGVSVYNTAASAYGGLPAGATVSFESDAIVDNDVAGAANGASPTLDFTNDWWGCVAGPGNPGCDAAIGAVDTSANTSAPPACVTCLDDGDCSDGLFCTGVETCNGAHQCVAGTNPCLGGDVCGNVCDEANDTCVVPPGTPCRPSAGPCDVAETCDGVSTSCPADGFAPPTTLCRAAVGECDAADFCSGAGPSCADGKKTSGTACTSDGNPCTLDQCDGSSDACQHPAGNAGAVCRASAGVCDVAETCDGTSPSCPADAFASSTTICRTASGQCDAAETCTGSSSACPIDASQPDGTSCDDGVACTIDDVCTAGVCGGNSMTCGDGIVQSGCGEICDDGNLVSGDGCSATCQPEFVCTPTPLTGCRTAASSKSQLQLKDKSPDTKDQSKWKWNKGAVTPKSDFGAPLATTDYQFCIYAGGTLVSRAHVPAGGTCTGNKPCWKENAKGYQYKNKDATPDGVVQLKLKEGTVAGKAQIQLKGKGVNLDMPTLPLAQPVLVQLRNSAGVCWETTHTAPATKNDATQYKDKND